MFHGKNPQALIVPYLYHMIHINNITIWSVIQPLKPFPRINTKHKKSSPCTRIKAFFKTHTCTVKALLLLEELLEQDAEFKLHMAARISRIRTTFRHVSFARILASKESNSGSHSSQGSQMQE
jgi:hypothetical protein